MDLLKRELAPITDAAWDEINEQSKEIFKTDLSARKFVDIEGPKGLEFSAVPTGRLEIPDKQVAGELLFGIRELQPVVEVRSAFTLDLWELDNIERGAGDVNLDALEKAARRLADFEEKAIYNGLKKANIRGLKQTSGHPPVNFAEKPEDILHTVVEAVTRLKTVSIEGPYSLILDAERWGKVSAIVNGYPLRLQLEQVLGGSLIFAPHIDGAFVVSMRGGDFRLTLGQDISIGYEMHTQKNVQLYFTEAFTFRALDPDAIIYMK
ncbi:MAG: family 1 encapsulin nanocompartment shell protein [Bacteroidales bacterium]|nr:family 1 encapsulin nanocompartment shell protein [Bacteroidales bacterium]